MNCLEEAIADWSEKHLLGSPVRYYPVIGRPEYQDTQIASQAWIVGDREAVVKIKGHAGGVSLRALEHAG